MKAVKECMRHPLLLIFALLIMGLFAVDLATPPQDFSVLENRKLQQRPDFDFSALWNNSYTRKYETFVNDQFTARNSWINLKSRTEYALGKMENNGVVYGKDGYLFDKYTTVDAKRLDNNTRYIQEFAEGYDGDITVMIVPSADGILTQALPEGMPRYDQLTSIASVYDSLSAPNLHPIDTADFLSQSKDAYIFYRTDHHWTTGGAWLAYDAYARSRGLTSVSTESLEAYRREAPQFLGTHYSKAKPFNPQPDTLTWYDIPVAGVTIDDEEASGLYDEEMFAQGDKYAGFLWGNNGLTVIRSGHNTNPQEGQTSRILLVKDSYGNCFAPFLTYHYDEIYVVDLRFAAGLQDLLAQTEFDDVLILYSFYNFTTDPNIPKLNYD